MQSKNSANSEIRIKCTNLSQRAVRIVGMSSFMKVNNWLLPALAITSLRPTHTPLQPIELIIVSNNKLRAIESMIQPM